MAVLLFAWPLGWVEASNGTRVACFNKGEAFTGAEPVFRKRTNKCTFVKKGEFVEAFTVRAKSIHWKRWASGQARGKGKDFIAMGGGYTPVKIKLSRPVARCGRRVYSKASFRYPEYGAGGGFRLDTC